MIAKLKVWNGQGKTWTFSYSVPQCSFLMIKENIQMEQDELSGIQAEINYMLRVPDIWKPVKAGNMKGTAVIGGVWILSGKARFFIRSPKPGDPRSTLFIFVQMPWVHRTTFMPTPREGTVIFVFICRLPCSLSWTQESRRPKLPEYREIFIFTAPDIPQCSFRIFSRLN